MTMSPESRAEISPEELEELEEWKTRLLKEKHQLKEQVKLLREALEASKSRMEIAAEYLHRFQGACAYHGDQLVGAIKRIDATLEATKEKT